MHQYALPDFPRKVESAPFSLDALHDVKTLMAVPESTGKNPVKLVLADMSEWGMSQVVPQRDGFRKVFVQIERARDGAGNLAHFEGMRQAGNIVVAKRCDEDLRLVLQPPERLAMDNAISVTLVLGAYIGGRLRNGATSGLSGLCGKWGEVLFALFEAVADG